MSDLIYPDMGKICRLCLQQDKGVVNIFPVNEVQETGPQLSIPMRIMVCASLEVRASDGLPDKICSECRYLLEKSYLFRKRSQVSDGKLRKHIRLMSAGKKSKVFRQRNANDDDDDEDDELEFEESLIFIKNEEDKMKLEQHQKLERHKEDLNIKYQKEMELSKEIIKKDVEKLLRPKIKSELEKELRGKIHAECLQEAKEQLRKEVQQECRQLEAKSLLNEIQQFLNERNGQELQRKREQSKDEQSPTPNKIYVKAQNSAAVPIRLINPNSRDENSIIIQEARSISADENDFIVYNLSKENNLNSASNRSSKSSNDFQESKILNDGIIDSETMAQIHEQLQSEDVIEGYNYSEDDDDDEDGVGGQDGDVAYDLRDVDMKIRNAEESQVSVGTTESYQIEDDGEIKFLKKSIQSATEEQLLNGNSDNIMILNFPQDDADELIDFEEELNEVVSKKPNASNRQATLQYYHTAAEKPLPANSIESTTTTSAIQTTTITKVETKLVSSAAAQRYTDTPKIFKCADCPVEFSTKNSYERHLRTHRAVVQKGVVHQCPKCNIVVSCKNSLKRHMYTHFAEKPYVCNVCEKSFVQREILKRHMQTHSGIKPYSCPHCDRSFAQRTNLRQHIVHNHLEKSLVQHHQCHLCPKRFNHASGLSRHLATHSGVAYQCSECERTFGDKSSVKRHIAKIHGAGTADKVEQTNQKY